MNSLRKQPPLHRRRARFRTRSRQMVNDLLLLALIWGAGLTLAPDTAFGLPVAALSRSQGQSALLASTAVLVSLWVLSRRGVYDQPRPPRVDEVKANVQSVLAATGAVALAAALLNTELGAREVGFAAGSAFVLRGILASLVRVVRLREGNVLRTVVVGSGADALDLGELITDHPESGLRLAGFLGDLPTEYVDHHLGSIHDLEEIVDRHEIDVLVIITVALGDRTLAEIIQRAQQLDVEVLTSAGVSRQRSTRLQTRSLSHEPLVVHSPNDIRRADRGAKRLIDISGAVLGLTLSAPLMVLIALAIKLDSRGPVFYHSKRFGRSAEEFAMLKFRTMHTDADDRREALKVENQRTGPLFKITNDPRVTRVGKFLRDTSLDEIPQFVNVLRGEMSLVGPRPATEDEEAAFAGEHRQRFNVRPGLSGLWQVEARSHPSFQAYRRLDLHYLENWSLGLDCLILLATIFQVIASFVALPLQRLGFASGTDGVRPTIDLTGQPDQPPVAENGAAAQAIRGTGLKTRTG